MILFKMIRLCYQYINGDEKPSANLYTRSESPYETRN